MNDIFHTIQRDAVQENVEGFTFLSSSFSKAKGYLISPWLRRSVAIKFKQFWHGPAAEKASCGSRSQFSRMERDTGKIDIKPHLCFPFQKVDDPKSMAVTLTAPRLKAEGRLDLVLGNDHSYSLR